MLSNILLKITKGFVIKSAIKSEITVPISTPEIPKGFTNIKDNDKLIIISNITNNFISLNFPEDKVNTFKGVLII